MSTLTSEAAESSDDIITMTGVSIHRGDDDWPIGLLSTLRDTARKYVPDKVDKVFNVMPDWRFNKHDVLLPHQVEDKYRGLRSIGREPTSPAVTEQVLQMLVDMVPKHDGDPLSRYRGRALKPLFRYQGCPAQPGHRDGRLKLKVVHLHRYSWWVGRERAQLREDAVLEEERSTSRANLYS